MAKSNLCTYYFEVDQDFINNLDPSSSVKPWPAGTYSAQGYMNGLTGWQNRLQWFSHRVWRQGPNGGVKIIKNKNYLHWSRSANKERMGYVTNNDQLMKEFAWIKLKAKHITVI